MLRLGLLFAFFVFAVTALPTFVYEDESTSSIRKSIHERDLTEVLAAALSSDTQAGPIVQITESNDTATSEPNKPTEEKGIDVVGSTMEEAEGTVSTAANVITNLGANVGSVASIFENNKATEGATNGPNFSTTAAYSDASTEEAATPKTP